MLIIFLMISFVFPIDVKTAPEKDKIAIIILNEDNKYHDKVFNMRKEDIQNQAKNFSEFQMQIFSSYQLLNSEVGHWTVFPLLELPIFADFNWLLFVDELTSINFEKMLHVFLKYNSSQELFVGYALLDKEPTIIHHFAVENSLFFPHSYTGFFLSGALVQRLKLRLPIGVDSSFSIDPKYELAKFIWDNGKGVQLQHEKLLCLTKVSEHCATWIDQQFPDCGKPIPSDELQVAVKTCHKFHRSRVTVIKNTWASETDNLIIFSDEEDDLIPMVKVPVKNVDHGHCEKTLTIMKYFLEKAIPLKWLAVVDDDTIFSVKRLQKLLSCYNSSDAIAMGERYGYSSANNIGYNYITGGGGLVFSWQTLKLLVQHCECPTIDSPDDMIIGMCLKRLSIPVVHSPYFHQARPTDYSSEILMLFQHVSFHKHWMIDPYSVYKKWLQDKPVSDSHTEL